jgi:actin-like ATPase involved in cell morphogenesis
MYQLGVDLGTTYTAAAVARDGRIEVVTLGSRAASIPSVLFLKQDGTLLVGDPANRRGLGEPDRVVREFKRRFGDPTPILLGGTPISADTLMAKLLRWVVDTVAEQQGGLPSAVTVSHPANWGPYKLDLLAQALRQADLPDPTTCTEPEAAAMAYASTERLEAGEVIAVYDLGGGTFDAAVLRKGTEGFEVLGRPEGLERLGGIDFDEAVYGHVATTVADALAEMDPDDPGDRAAVARLREECVEAKEALSADTDVTIPILLTVRREVRLTRGEFESMIRPALDPTVDALKRTIASAGLGPADVKTIVLVGGSSRIPLVGQLLASELGRPVSVDVHPKHAVAIGAARIAGDHAGAMGEAAAAVPSSPPPPPAPSAPPPAPPPAPSAPPPAPPPEPPLAPPPESPTPPSEPPPAARPKSARRIPLPKNRAVRALVAVAIVGIAGAAILRATPGGLGGDRTTTTTWPPPLTLAQAKSALGKVLAGEHVYQRAHGTYSDSLEPQYSPDFTVPGVRVERMEAVFLAERRNAVVVYQVGDAIFLNALAERRCLYVKATSPDDVQTAEVAAPGGGEYPGCPESTKVAFNGQAWALPA